MKTAIHEKICELRKAKGMTQEQLGANLGVSGQAVSKWEKGEALPDILLLPDLCKLLGISADQLLEIPKDEPGALIRVSNDRTGFTFEMKGYAHRKECMQLDYEDAVYCLGLLTNELTYKVLVQIPFIEDEYITPKQIAQITGFSDADVDKALRILQKRKVIEEVSDRLDEEGLDVTDGREPKYWQNDAAMIGFYQILTGCLGNRRPSNDEPPSKTITTRQRTEKGNVTTIENIFIS
ncbi:MAG: helix-turn-helix domain-containing protein [Eubacteriales bacterium]